jgi:hypothetical protein
MGLFFGLNVECGPEDRARDISRHFTNLELVLSTRVTVSCSSRTWQGPDGSWWADALPFGASVTGTPGRDVPDLRQASRMSEMGHLLYDRLRSAPEFRYALVGKETDEFRLFGQLDQDVLLPAFAGLVISEEIWHHLGRPAPFESFRPGYVWRPYLGETSDL